MAQSEAPDTRDSPPWAAKRVPSGRHLVRSSLPWLAGILLVAVISWGLWPKPVIIETGVVARSALTTRIAEEGKTRVRNRYVVAAPVAGKMRRVTLKAGDPVRAGSTVLTPLNRLRRHCSIRGPASRRRPWLRCRRRHAARPRKRSRPPKPG